MSRERPADRHPVSGPDGTGDLPQLGDQTLYAMSALTAYCDFHRRHRRELLGKMPADFPSSDFLFLSVHSGAMPVRLLLPLLFVA